MSTEFKLWEILVPSDRELSEHRDWDREIDRLVTGHTLGIISRGYWHGEGEGMLAVRIACDEETMFKVAEMTRRHYAQDTVMFYLVSPQVEFVREPYELS